MEIRNLGKSGLRVSAIGLGCNNFGARINLEQTRAVIHKAFDLGITLFDTADVYGERGGSETCMGQVLGDRRKDIVLASKFCMPMGDGDNMKGASRRYIMAAVDASLTRLADAARSCLSRGYGGGSGREESGSIRTSADCVALTQRCRCCCCLCLLFVVRC